MIGWEIIRHRPLKRLIRLHGLLALIHLDDGGQGRYLVVKGLELGVTIKDVGRDAIHSTLKR